MNTLLAIACVSAALPAVAAASPLRSIDTGDYTITKVRSAIHEGRSFIVASSYEGSILAIDYGGAIRWTNALSGFTNHDLWCADLDGDRSDEILAANPDGAVYCLDAAHGKLRWTFRANEAPMYSVCVVRQDGNSYVVCGGFDKNVYYLSAHGELIKTLPSRTYSVEKTWGKRPERVPPKGEHTVNFLRPLRLTDGTERLVVLAAIHSLSAPGRLYLFKPLADKPEKIIKPNMPRPAGDMRVRDIDGDGEDEILLGTSTMIHDSALVVVDPQTGRQQTLAPSKERALLRQLDRFGYRVVQPEFVRTDHGPRILVLFGSRIILLDPKTAGGDTAEVFACRYAFNDLWLDSATGRILLASAQSGGSCVHVIDPRASGWQSAYEDLSPPGKIAAILRNAENLRRQLAGFRKPAWERDPLPVIMMTESIPDSLRGLVERLQRDHGTPVFLNGVQMAEAENWDRFAMANTVYRQRRDGRKRYTATGDQIVTRLTRALRDAPGIAYWGGHGNDPYMISLATQKRIIDAVHAQGKMLVTIYPELEDSSDDFAFVMEDLFYPLAEYCRGKDAKIFIRSKHLFWQTSIYRPMWARFRSGEFADVFVPAMEETTDKSMELSLAARLGLWASGLVDDWGTRCARDNASFDRLRQHSHQMLPNHFLRTLVYHLSLGARYLNNFPVDQEYMSVLWELIAKGALYVPKRNEILSFSPVRVAMKDPDPHLFEEGNNVKWTTFHDEQFERENPFVFSRLNGTWPGAPVTEWDFSRYAAGVKERRLNFLPPYPHGLVLITPSDETATRRLEAGLHPWYRGRLKAYVTDGLDYISPDGRRHPADVHYRTVEADIIQSASELPLTVSGNVAWVTAATAPRHLRLTLVDAGYLNPRDRLAVVTFHQVRPTRITDMLSGRDIPLQNDNTAEVPVPCGLFRFLDIELAEPIGSRQNQTP